MKITRETHDAFADSRAVAPEKWLARARDSEYCPRESLSPSPPLTLNCVESWPVGGGTTVTRFTVCVTEVQLSKGAARVTLRLMRDRGSPLKHHIESAGVGSTFKAIRILCVFLLNILVDIPTSGDNKIQNCGVCT